MQVPGRSAALAAVLPLCPCCSRVRRLGRLRRARGGGHRHRPSSTTTPPTSRRRASTSPQDALEAQVDDALPASTAAPRSRSCSSSGCASTTWTPATPLVDDGVGGVFLAGRSQAPVEGHRRRHRAVAGRGPRPRRCGWPSTRRAARSRPSRVRGSTGCPPRATRVPCPPTSSPRSPRTSGTSLAAAGVNLDLAPVVDVVPPGTEAGNAPIGAYGREYGGTAGGGHRGGRHDRRRALRRRRHRDPEALPRPGPGAAATPTTPPSSTTRSRRRTTRS